MSRFSKTSEALLNNQVTSELEANMVYTHLWAKYGRMDFGMPNLAAHFYNCSKEEREHAELLIKYINLRCGIPQMNPVKFPCSYNVDKQICTVDEIVEEVRDDLYLVLDLERDIYEKLLAIHRQSTDDPHLTDFLEENLLKEQVESLRACEDMVRSYEKYMHQGGLALFDLSLKK